MLTFTAVLHAAGIAPASVRLLRHQENRHPGAPSPYVLWRDHRDRFETYQETHAIREAAKLNAPLWASFVGLPDRQTLFVGLYSAEMVGLLPADRLHPLPHRNGRGLVQGIGRPPASISLVAGALLRPLPWG